MSDTHAQFDGKSHLSPAEVAWKFAWPFFGFCAVLTGLMALSWTYVLPRYTQINVNGSLLDARMLTSRKIELETDIAKRETDRRSFVSAIHDPAYKALMMQRQSRTPLSNIRKELTAHFTKVAGRDDAIVISKWEYNAGKNTLVLTGDVRNADTGSMTLLAKLSTSFASLPFVASASTPAFARMDDTVIGLHSPFVITLTLK